MGTVWSLDSSLFAIEAANNEGSRVEMDRIGNNEVAYQKEFLGQPYSSDEVVSKIPLVFHDNSAFQCLN